MILPASRRDGAGELNQQRPRQVGIGPGHQSTTIPRRRHLQQLGGVDLKIFAEYPASRNHREPSRNLVTCGKESARYYTKASLPHSYMGTPGESGVMASTWGPRNELDASDHVARRGQGGGNSTLRDIRDPLDSATLRPRGHGRSHPIERAKQDRVPMPCLRRTAQYEWRHPGSVPRADRRPSASHR